MNPENLKSHLQRYYGAKQPPAALTKNVQAMLAASRAPGPSRRPWLPALALAAAALFGIFAASSPSRSPVRAPGPVLASGQIQGLAREVAAHHTRCQMAPGDETSDIQVARGRLTNLGFQLFEPSVLTERGLQVMGARRCLMNGEVAAELRVKDSQGRVGTLLVTRVPTGLSSLAARKQIIDGLDVELWTEAGLLVGLAVPA